MSVILGRFDPGSMRYAVCRILKCPSPTVFEQLEIDLVLSDSRVTLLSLSLKSINNSMRLDLRLAVSYQ